MIFVLHHSKGALLLEAEDRQQVLNWTQRQLGEEARLSTIMEAGDRQCQKAVERSGTGVQSMERTGCNPLTGLSADVLEPENEQHKDIVHSVQPRWASHTALAAPTWH